MRKIYVTSIFLLVVVTLLIYSCRGGHGFVSADDIKAHHLIDSFNRLSRTEQVKTCGSCHVKEYMSEMSGPHTNAVKMLQNHLDYVDSKLYDDKDYKSYVNEKRGGCISCHAGDNKYAAMLKQVGENEDSLKVYIDYYSHTQPGIRKGDKTTGTDCITCHYDGTRVITTKGFDAKNAPASPPYCNPLGSILLTHSNSCLGCHYDEYKGLSKTVSSNCLSCHQQYDTAGKGTHYIYWRHDDSLHPKPQTLRIMDDISAQYDAKQSKVIVQWKNTRLPHPMALFVESIAYLEVADNKGKVLGKGLIRLNRRDEYNLNMQSRGYNPLKGISGYTLSLDGKPIYDTISNIKASSAAGLQIKITGAEKGQVLAA